MNQSQKIKLRNSNMCLFEKRHRKLDKLFQKQLRQRSNYQISGDQKSEDEMQIDFLNSIDFKPYYSSQRDSVQGRPNIITPIQKSNHIIDSLNKNIENTSRNSLQEEEKQSNNSSPKNMISKKKSFIPQTLDPTAPSADMLLKLYDEGMYDPRNPAHQRGKIILSEKEKDKWKLTDYHHLIYATKIKDYHPFCFFYGTKYKDLVREDGSTRYPEGKLVNYNDWQKEPDYTLKGIYGGIEINNKVGLVIVDPNVKKKYSGLVADIIIQLLKVPFGHHMCLNVKIFEPKCLEERLTNVFSYANRYLIPASDPSLSPYERFKEVITFIMSGMYIPAQQLKPFNPYLGETFQGELPNGAKIYVEQVTHKPLCCRFYMFYKNVYKLYGYFNFSVRSEGLGSTMYVDEEGPCTVEFPQLNERITFCVPEIKIVNARNEEGRANLYSGCMVFVDIKNKYKGVIQFGFNKKLFHDIRGMTFKCNYPPGYKFVYETEWKWGKKVNIEKEKKSPNFLDEIKGSWINNLYIGNKLHWDVKAQIPEFIKPTKTCLPSDGRFREDLCWLWKSFYEAKNEKERKTYENISQDWKLLMEDFNRWDRKRRADYNESIKGRYK